MADMKLLGMFAAFEQSVVDATRDQTSYSDGSQLLTEWRRRLFRIGG